MPIEDEQATFIRRKFTITETLDNVLTNMAEQHYQGNVSLCLRAAIEDHRTSVNGTKDAIVVEQLSRQVASVQTQQEEMVSDIQSIKDQLSSDGSDEDDLDYINDSNMTDAMQMIYTKLFQAEKALRIEDIAEKSNQTTAQIQPALGNLIDQGHVTMIDGNSQRFQLTGLEEKYNE